MEDALAQLVTLLVKLFVLGLTMFMALVLIVTGLMMLFGGWRVE